MNLPHDREERLHTTEGKRAALFAKLMERSPERTGRLIRAAVVDIVLDQLRPHHLAMTAELPASARTRLIGEGDEVLPPSWSRRPLALLATAAALLMMIAALWVFSAGWLTPDNGTYATRVGESQVVHLTEGSTVTLNTSTTFEWAIHRSDRQTRLVLGEALFDVVHDEAHPFHVAVDDWNIQVVGTRFNVYRKPSGDVRVTVLEGTVKIGTAGSVPTQVLNAGDEALIHDRRVLTSVLSEREIRKRSLWTEGFIEARGETLGEVVAEMNRYSETQILIVDPEIAGRRLGGRYRLGDTSGFVRGVSEVFKLRAVTEPGEEHVVRLTLNGAQNGA